MSNTPQSPEELRRLQELAELFDDDTAPSPATTTPRTTPSGGSEVLNAAKHWGRAFGRKTKELTEKAAENTKEAQEALARRAEEAKERKEATAAEQARQQQEQAEREEAAKPAACAQPVDVCAPEPVSESTTVALEEPSRAYEPLVPVVVVEPEAVEPKTLDVLAGEEAVKPADLSVASEALEDVEALPPSTSALCVANTAAVQPEPSPAHATPAGSISTTISRKKGWSIVVVAGVACLVLGGGIAWWVTRDTGKNEPAPTAAPASAVAAPVSTPAVPVPEVEPAPPVSAPEPEQAPLAVQAPPALPVEKGAAPALAEAPRAAARAEAQPVKKGDKRGPEGVKRPRAVVAKATSSAGVGATPAAKKPAAEKPREETQWQEKAESDMDAWAKKAGIN